MYRASCSCGRDGVRCGRRSLVQAGLESTPGPGWDSRLEDLHAVCRLLFAVATRRSTDSDSALWTRERAWTERKIQSRRAASREEMSTVDRRGSGRRRSVIRAG